MAFMFHRRLAIPLWGLAFCMIALAAPAPATLWLMVPSTRFALAVVGIAVLLFTIVHSRGKTRAGMIVAAGTRVWTLDEPVRRTAEDALDLVRMDDDGGWQMATPPTERRLESALWSNLAAAPSLRPKRRSHQP